MKAPKTYSLRTAQAVARYGKATRHPVCQAAIQLWQVDAELLKLAKDICSLSEVLSSARKQKKQAQALLDLFYKERREKDVIDAAALVQKINEHLKETEGAYQAMVKAFTLWIERPRRLAAARFAREYDDAVRAKDTKAQRALQRVHKLWSANPDSNGVRLKDGPQRTLGTLQLLRDKVTRATSLKGGAAAGFWEAVTGGDRPLSDESWQGRLTVRESHSHLLRIGGPSLAGDKEGKEIRRVLVKKLGIRPAEDQRGRKRKGPSAGKQKPQQPLGRPPSKPDIVSTDELEAVRAMASQGKALFIKSESEDIDREIARLTRRRERLGIKERKRNEGMIKGRSAVFAQFVDSD